MNNKNAVRRISGRRHINGVSTLPLRIAVLGAGRIGQVHARAIASVPGARLVAIAEPVETVARKVAAEFGCEVRSIEACAASDGKEPPAGGEDGLRALWTWPTRR